MGRLLEIGDAAYNLLHRRRWEMRRKSREGLPFSVAVWLPLAVVMMRLGLRKPHPGSWRLHHYGHAIALECVAWVLLRCYYRGAGIVHRAFLRCFRGGKGLPLHHSRDWLVRQRYGRGLRYCEMADLAGCSARAVTYRLEKHGVRNARGVKWAALVWECGRGGAEAYRRRYLRPVHRALLDWLKPCGPLLAYRDPDWLRQRYIVEGWTGVQIGNLCDVHTKKVYTWMEVHGVERRASMSGHKGPWPRNAAGRKVPPSSSLERKAAKALDILGIEYETQYQVKGWPYYFDIFVPPNVLVECQGEAWHTGIDDVRRDQRKARVARDYGFKLVTLWGEEMRERGALVLLEERVLPVLAPPGTERVKEKTWWTARLP